MIVNNVYCLNLDKVKIYFLNGDYNQAILEAEKILASYGSIPNLDELYYILGLSYLKKGNYLRASDIFEIILKEYKDSAFSQEAKMSLADTYLLRQDYDKAEHYYKDLIVSNPHTKLKAIVYYRLGQVGIKKSDTQKAKEYLDKLKEEFPLNLEIKLNKDLYTTSYIYYTVQVGSFINPSNAKNLCNKLIDEGYDAYIQELDTGGKRIYRVRVGRLNSRLEAVQLENKLSSQGYLTKIIP